MAIQSSNSSISAYADDDSMLALIIVTFFQKLVFFKSCVACEAALSFKKNVDKIAAYMPERRVKEDPEFFKHAAGAWGLAQTYVSVRGAAKLLAPRPRPPARLSLRAPVSRARRTPRVRRLGLRTS